MKPVVALLAVAFASVVAERAHACSAPACNESWTAPDTGKAVPANAPALVFVAGTGPFGGPAPGPPTLKSAAEPIAVTRDGIFLRPSAALPIGELTLEWDEACIYPRPDSGLSPKQISVTVVAPTPLPTALGSATLAYARENVSVWTSSGSCTDVIDSSVARFTLALDPALEKFRAVARFVTRVDGADWGASAWGRAGPVAKPSPYGGDMGVHRHDLVFAACGPSPIGVTDRGVAIGKHTVEIRAEVAGAPAIPAATFDIDLRCDGTKPDGGSVIPDAAIPDASVPDAPVGMDATPDAAPNEETVVSGCGCTTAPAQALPLPFALLALALGLTRRRR